MRSPRIGLLASLCTAIALGAAGTASAYTVNTTADLSVAQGASCLGAAVTCSLRAAVDQVGNGQNTVVIPHGVYKLTQGALGGNSQDMTITGSGARGTIIRQTTPGSAVLNAGGNLNLSVSGVTMTGGNRASGSGGAINASAPTLTLTNVSLIGNSAPSGGAVRSTGALNITSSTFAANRATAGNGGALDVTNGFGNPGTVLRNLTFSGNTASGLGAAIHATEFFFTINNSTFADNEADLPGRGVFSGGPLTLRNTVVDSGVTSTCESPGVLAGGGNNNVFHDDTCTHGPNELYHQNAALLPLTNVGGATDVRPLPAGSASINSGDAGTCHTTDQRGAARQSTCDRGAYEFGALPNAGLSLTTNDQVIPVGGEAQLIATVRNYGGGAITPTVHITLPAGVDVTGTTPPAGGSCSVGATLACALGSIPAGGQAVLAATVSGATAGTKSIVATTTTPAGDVNPGDDNASVTVRVNPAPTVSSTAAGNPVYAENAAPVAVDPTVAIADADDAVMLSGLVHLDNPLPGDELAYTTTAGVPGVVNVAKTSVSFPAAEGPYTKAALAAAMRAVTFTTTSDTPAPILRAILFTVSDGVSTSAPLVRPLNVTATNDPPVLGSTSTGALAFSEGQAAAPIDPALVHADPDSATLASGVVTLVNPQPGDELASATGTVNGAKTTVTFAPGPFTPSDLVAAMRAVTFRNTSEAPSAQPRTVTFRVNDGTDDSNAFARSIAVTPVNDAPVLSTTTTGALAHTEGEDAKVVDPAIAVADLDDQALTAVVTLVDAAPGDELSAPSGTRNAAATSIAFGPLAPGALAEALRSVRFRTTIAGPSVAARRVTFSVADGASPSNTLERAIAVTLLPPVTKTITTTTAKPTPTPAATPPVVPAPPVVVPRPARDTAPPKLTAVKVGGKLGGNVTVVLVSDEPVALAGSATRNGAAAAAGAAPLRAAGTQRLTLKLNAKAKKALKRARRATLVVTVVATDAAGNATKTTKTLRLSRRA